MSLKANKLLKLDRVDTIADGTRTSTADVASFKIMKEYVNEIRTVSDEEIIDAMELMIQKGKIVVEPSSAMVIAAFINKDIAVTRDDKVCFVISGGNNDIEFLGNILINCEVLL